MKIFAVGIGPGAPEYLAPEAYRILTHCDVVVGYTLYVDLVYALVRDKKIIRTGMKGELSRCESALAEARRGKNVAVISSGDAGVYGMAALLLELAENEPGIDVVVIPGITAATAAAALLGAPLSNDFAVISLSDLLTPWSVIEKRLEAAGAGDFVVCLYNPKSKSRRGHLDRACNIFLKHKPPETWCGYVRNAFRADSSHGICTLFELPEAGIDMLTTVIVGNAETRRVGNRLFTARGYHLKQSNETEDRP